MVQRNQAGNPWPARSVPFAVSHKEFRSWETPVTGSGLQKSYVYAQIVLRFDHLWTRVKGPEWVDAPNVAR